MPTSNNYLYGFKKGTLELLCQTVSIIFCEYMWQHQSCYTNIYRHRLCFAYFWIKWKIQFLLCLVSFNQVKFLWYQIPGQQSTLSSHPVRSPQGPQSPLSGNQKLIEEKTYATEGKRVRRESTPGEYCLQLYWRVNNQVPVCYRQPFGDYNITKKLHEIPYDTVTHWNKVINTYLHRQLSCSFSTFFPHQQQWQWKRKGSHRGDFPRHIPSWLELNMQRIYCSVA